MQFTFKFSIRAIFVSTVIVAWAAVAIGQDSKFWSLAFVNALLALVMAAFLGAIFRKGRARAWSFGFFVGTAGYLMLCRFEPGIPVSTGVINMLRVQFPFLASSPHESVVFNGEFLEPAEAIGHSLFVVAAGVFGGYVARYFYSIDEERR